MIIKEQQINEQIRDKELRVIDEDGTQLGILSAKEAQNLATQKNLDLVKISPNANPPVCKIMDYNKYKYENSKKQKENKKKQREANLDIKEYRLSVTIDVHDFNTRVRNSLKYLEKGHKVKVSVRFKGREMAHTELGREVLERFADALKEVSDVEQKPKMDGRFMTMMLIPKKEK